VLGGSRAKVTLVDRQSVTNTRNSFCYRIVEELSVEELKTLLKQSAPKAVDIISDTLHLRRVSFSSITLFNAEQIKKMTLLNVGASAATQVCEILTRPMTPKSQEVLGKHFEDPSYRRIKKLTKLLITEFGSTLTKMYYASTIDQDMVASPHLRRELTEKTGLDIPPEKSLEPNAAPTPRPAATNDQKRSRRQHRQDKKEVRASLRTQNMGNRKIEKLRAAERKEKNKVELNEPKVTVARSTKAPVATIQKRIHPMLSRFQRATGKHELIGQLFYTFISFGNKADPENGKFRPCVIVAVAPKYVIVRPIFSHARGPAGRWKVVAIEDWLDAGLSHESYVGDRPQRILRYDVGKRIGELTLRDWNRICIGEVNATD
jgi:hypothetical protein